MYISQGVHSYLTGQGWKCETQTSLLIEHRLIITIEQLEIYIFFKLTLNAPKRFNERAPLFRSFPWASQVATEMSRTAAGWKQSRSNRCACGKKLWSLIIKYQQNYDSVSRHLRAQAGISWKAARCGYLRGVAPDNAFIRMEKRHYKGLLYWLLCVISRRDRHLAALCTLCKGSGESHLVCLSVCLRVCLSLAGSCLPTLKANICSFITFPLLLSSPVDALLTPSGPNMKSGLSLAAAALVAVLLSSVDAQGRTTATRLRSLLSPSPLFSRLPLPPPLIFALRWFFMTEIWCFIVHSAQANTCTLELDVLIKRNKVLDSHVRCDECCEKGVNAFTSSLLFLLFSLFVKMCCVERPSGLKSRSGGQLICT